MHQIFAVGLISAGGYARWIAGVATGSKVLTGASLGGAFYTAGQMSKGEEVRFGELGVNMATAAAIAPLATTNAFINAVLVGGVGAANTAATNWMYGENGDIERAFLAGASFSVAGTTLGKFTTNLLVPYDLTLHKF